MNGRTLSAYLADVNHFCSQFGLTLEQARADDLASIKTPQIQSYLKARAERGISPSTLKRNLASIRRMYASLLSSGLIQENPAGAVRLRPDPGELIPAGSIPGMFSYLQGRTRFGGRTVNVRDQLILLFLLFLGVRRYRIPTLRLKDLRRDRLGLTLRLSDRKTILIDGVVLASLHAYLGIRQYTSDALFLDPHGRGAITPSALGDLITSVEEAVDVDLSSKVVHRTFCWLQNNSEKSSALETAITPLLA